MSRENEMIELINKQMPKSKSQINDLFECDSEIIDFNGTGLAYNIDEFSEEDMFREEDPYTLGWNVAVGSISDILAAGGIPKFYAHSLVMKRSWSTEYVQKLAEGISDVLEKAGTSFIGGDFGISDSWRYTGSVFGQIDGKPMLRSGAKTGDMIFISGKIGIGNVEAAIKIYSDNNWAKKITGKIKNQFKLRCKEACLIKQYSKCCIDTSDGVFNALNTICDISKVGFNIKNLKYDEKGRLLSRLLKLPIELLFLGECGEYELLFTISKEFCEEFLDKCNELQLKFYKLGEIEEAGKKLLHSGEKKFDLSLYDLRARDYNDTKEYLKNIMDFLNSGRVT